MFSGIIELVGTITDTQTVPGGRSLGVDLGAIARECEVGSSLCISGICLTVTRVTGRCVYFDVITETLKKTVLGSKAIGDRVNIERSLRADSRLDGHFVQGHVDGTAAVERIHASPRERVVWLRPERSIGEYIIPKGSVAVDGVSMTIAEVRDGAFSIALIPTTLEKTTLSSLARGDRVNIETDIIARTVVHSLSEMSHTADLRLDALRKAGFA